MRIIAVFEKSERIRHIGHLDIQRFVQRGLRRSGLPVSYSQGFNPHIRLSFASALSTGACGLREIMDVPMASSCSAEEFISKMNLAMPPEMRVKEARVVDDKHPAMTELLKAASYDILLRNSDVADQIRGKLTEAMHKERMPAMRKTKSGIREVDLKPLIYSVAMEGCHVYATLALTQSDVCKPDMLLSYLASEAGIILPEQMEESSKRLSGFSGTDSFGNHVKEKTAFSLNNSPVRMLVTRTALLGETEQGLYLPLERL